MSPDNALNIPALRRSGSGASLSTLADSRKTRSSTLHTSQTAQQSGCRRQCRPPLSCASKFAKICKLAGRALAPTTIPSNLPLVPLYRSRFEFPFSTSNQADNQTSIPQGPKIPITPNSAMQLELRPARHLILLDPLWLSLLPTPKPFGYTRASNSTRASESLPSTEVQKQLTKALDKLSRTQEECTHWKTRAEEVRLWIEQCEKDQYKERISFCEEIKQLEDQHAQTVQQIKNNLGAQLTRAQEEIENLLTSTAKYQEDLQRLNDQVDRLNSKVKQMDIDFGHSAAQAMELTRVKTELKIRLEASQSELDQNIRANQNRVNQVSEHYHNIQSKLHQDLEQMTAEYQASLEKQEHSPSPEFFNQLKSKTNQLEQKIKSQEIEFCKSQAEMNSSPTIPHESYAETLENLKNTEAELKNLKSELKSVNGSIADQQKSAYDTEKEQTTAQIALRDEFESVQTGLKTQLSCAQQAIEDMRSSTVPLENHEKILKDLKTLESELSSLKSELLSSQETCQVASNNLNSSQQTIHVLEDSLRALKKDSVDLKKLNNVHAQTLSKLDELSAFNPQQISVLTSRLREERNESQRAIDFMQVEWQTLENTSRDLISKLQSKQHQILQEATAERNTLISQGSGIEASTKIKEAPMEDSHISLASHLRADLGLDCDDGLKKLEIDGHEGNNRIDPQAYKTALDQIDSLTKRLDDLKEQLIQTHMAHEEQEKLALHDTETIHSQLHLSKEQHSQAEEQQAHVIASRELQFSGIQHQFNSMEASYDVLRKDNEELNSGIQMESKTSRQLMVARESMQATTDSLRSQIESMNAEIETYKQQISDLQENNSPANQDLVAAVVIQNDHLASVKQLEEILHGQKDDSKVELEHKEAELVAQRGNLKKQLSELQDALDKKLALNMRLQANVHALTAQIQEEQDVHQRIQAESEAKLSGAIQNRSTVDEKYQRLENQIEEPLEKTRAPEEENRSLNNKLEVATEEQQANKEKTATDLSRTKEQLTEAISARDSLSKQLDQMNQDVRLLTEKLEQLCSEEELVKQSSEKYQTLLSEFKALGEQLPALFSELEVVRSELESATGMVKDMTSEVKEKDSIIDQLEADLATANKLQGSVSSSDNPMTMEQVRELEERVESFTLEAEDAVDKLIKEMQRNKQLLNLVEMLKIKLKSRTKSTILSSEQRAPQESSEDPPRVEPSSSAPEPDDQSASSSSRKQKHEPTNSDIAGTRLKIQINDDKNDAKENPSGTNGRQPIRRKISANRDEEDCQDDLNSKTDEIRNDSIGVLKPVSVNQQSNIPCTTTTESAREYSKVTIKPPKTTTSTTNSTLLASIQSLRRKQQLQKQQQQQQAISVQAARIGGTTTNSAGAGASKVQMDEPRRSSLRLVRKDQENP
ncbi:hypothetical protein PSTG_07098 [Puccinia striiformis f. sp. tritici PST-78]|uniref:Uncharacterized protein n=1 Tax=Puccinia striiformis f. sp. tritici PST-78 TaxID=1165861 RepID=A0A0L0VK03_9BASI|nr:hypothetical protein PSTG_07098 [Puccinia striiformis f. sp. tritici PST-78]